MAQSANHPKRQVLIKFVLLLGLLAAYFGYLTHAYGLATGGIASALTWSFFVLCTPIADAGFLLDFPLRLIFGIRMVVSEIAVWAIAIALNLAALAWFPGTYDKTLLTTLLHRILVQPVPYWSVIALSGAGTFLSIRFGDELMDVLHHRDRHFFHSHAFKHELILFAFMVVIIFVYYRLIASLGIEVAG